jgi:hypothetical protein
VELSFERKKNGLSWINSYWIYGAVPNLEPGSVKYSVLMAVFIVDASVALAWCFEDEKTDWTEEFRLFVQVF